MKSIAAIATALIGVAWAAPVADELFSIAKRSISEIADFDGLSPGAEPALAKPPVPYKGLNFTNLNLVQPGVDGLARGVKPNSSPDYIASGPRARLDGPATFSVVGTSTSYFNLDQFYYGCLLATQEQQTQVSRQCSFEVTGYKKDGKTVGPKPFTYTPDNANDATMTLATFEKSSWAELTRVELKLTSSVVEMSMTVLVVDTAQYAVEVNSGSGGRV